MIHKLDQKRCSPEEAFEPLEREHKITSDNLYELQPGGELSASGA